MTQSFDIRKGTVLTATLLQSIFLRMFRKINRIFPEQIKYITTGQLYCEQRTVLSCNCDQYDNYFRPSFDSSDSYLSKYEKEIAILEKK